jgi:hypothetical protein
MENEPNALEYPSRNATADRGYDGDGIGALATKKDA